MSYSGYCVGGPMHNKRLEHDKGYYRLELSPPFPTLQARVRHTHAGQGQPIAVKTGEYRWHKEQECWLWVG